MATSRDALHIKQRSVSAPSTRRRMDHHSHGRPTIIDSPHMDLPKIPERPLPNYLKHTVSSCHDTNCHYPKNQQQPPPKASPMDFAFGRRISSRKPIEKARSLSSQTRKHSNSFSSRERTTKTVSPSLKPVICSKPSLDRASKSPAGGRAFPLGKIKSIPKTTAVKKTEVNGTVVKSKEEDVDNAKVLQADIPQSTLRRDITLESSKEAEMKKVKLQESREVEENTKAEPESVAMKREEVKGRKESTQAYNNVIEEAANKLAARRNKVLALAGAFETVISLQKPEGKSIQQEEEVAVKNEGDGDGQTSQHVQEEEVARDERESQLEQTDDVGQESQPAKEKVRE